MEKASHSPPTAVSARAEAFAVVLQAHRREGYDAGYRRAISDVLAASVYIAEQALAAESDPADPRQAIYRFIAKLEQETLRLAKVDQAFGDGGGI